MGRVMPMSRRHDFNRSGRPYGRPGGRGRRGQELYLVHSGASFWGDTFAGVGALFWLGWRQRSDLAPVYWLAGVMAFGAWLHAVHPNWWPLPVAVGLVAMLSLLLGRPRALAVKFPLLRRPKVQYFALAFSVTVSAWLTVATFVGATAGPMETVAVAAMVALGTPWWLWDQRRRLVKVRRVVERFTDYAEAAGLPNARIVQADLHPWGWVARVRLRPGHRFDHAVKALPDLESALGTRVGALRVEMVNANASAVRLRLVESDPHAEAIPYPLTAGKRPASIKDPVTVGVWEDGTDVTVSLLRQHVLIGGMTDSGKSGLLNVILARFAECRDVLVWGVDLKEGMEFTPWRKTLHRLAVNTREAEILISDAVGELERRAAFLADKGLRVWEPSPDAPALAVVIDEYAELSPKARRLVDSIARRGRAVAVTLVIATQRPSQKTMGEGTAIRSQLNVRFCLQVRERADVDLILGQGMQAAWDTTGFDAPGKFLMVAPGHNSPRRARAYLIADKAVTQTANQHAKPGNITAQTNSAGSSATATGEHYTARQDGDAFRVYKTPTAASQGPLRAPGTAAGTSGVSGPDMALWEALGQAPAHGVSIAELMTATGRSKRWVHYRLERLHRDHRAERAASGRWRAKPRAARNDPTPPEPGAE